MGNTPSEMSTDPGESSRATADRDPFAPPFLCKMGCGFFGSAETGDCCSKCWASIKQQTDESASGPINEKEVLDDALGELVKTARKVQEQENQPIKFNPSASGAVLPNAELHLNDPQTPSALTMDTYFRRDHFSLGVQQSTPAETPSTGYMTAAEFLTNSSLASRGHNIRYGDDSLADTRIQLDAVIRGAAQGPVWLPTRYIDAIKTSETLGVGFFGQVFLGIDEELGKRFAIKLINPLVIEQSLAHRLELIQKSFKNEIDVLSRLKHPNIASLYGYRMGDEDHAPGFGASALALSRDQRNNCLLYELAINGSLDTFLSTNSNENILGRERLSDAKVRVRIALEVATVLRYMHEGLDGDAKCFHRDIKSANIALAADFSARVIDCGLSKYVIEESCSFSSNNRSGTPGYTCPQYLQGEIPFCSACDVFSFGVLLCELITSRVSSPRSPHYSTYKQIRRRLLEDDADELVDWDVSGYLERISKLAMDCLEYEACARPKIGSVVEELQSILRGDQLKYLEGEQSSLKCNSEPSQCRTCGVVSDLCIKCFGSCRHVHCKSCFENRLLRNMQQFNYDLTCPFWPCNSRPFDDEEVAGVIAQNVWNLFSSQRDSIMTKVRDFESEVNLVNQLKLANIDAKLVHMQELMLQLCAGNGLPCPRLFLIVEADRNVKLWRNPKQWLRDAASTKLYIYFICSHSLRPVSDRCRIKVRYTREWLRAIAPALNVSLDIIKLSLNLSIGRDTPLDFARVHEMDEWAKGLLDSDEKSLFDDLDIGSRHQTTFSFQPRSWSEDRKAARLKSLVGNSLSKIAEKAAATNVNWQNELVPVYDYKRKEPTFVMKEYASDRRYCRESVPQSTQRSFSNTTVPTPPDLSIVLPVIQSQTPMLDPASRSASPPPEQVLPEIQSTWRHPSGGN